VSLIAEVWEYLHARKKFWLLPLLALIFALGGLVVLIKGSVVAPFIYTVF
jgi:hypothetical protein